MISACCKNDPDTDISTAVALSAMVILPARFEVLFMHLSYLRLNSIKKVVFTHKARNTDIL